MGIVQFIGDHSFGGHHFEKAETVSARWGTLGAAMGYASMLVTKPSYAPWNTENTKWATILKIDYEQWTEMKYLFQFKSDDDTLQITLCYFQQDLCWVFVDSSGKILYRSERCDT